MRSVEAGNGVILSPMTAAEIAAMSERAWQAFRDELKEKLNFAQASEAEGLRRIDELYEERGTRIPAIRHATRINGARDIVTTACRAQGVSPEHAMDGLDVPSLVRVAQLLVGFDQEEAERSRSGERGAGGRSAGPTADDRGAGGDHRGEPAGIRQSDAPHH